MTTSFKKIVLLALSSVIFLYGFSKITHNVNAGMVCTCAYYEYYSCPGNAGCKDTYKCKPGTCKRCGSTVCRNDDPPPPPCQPLTLKCVTTCGFTGSCMPNGCGGQVCCPSTAACKPTVPPIVACVDSDGGSAPNVSGKVTISAPALPQVLEDSCIYLKVQTIADGSQSSQWIKQATGTHVAEKTCTNIATGAYADTTLVCPMGCTNGACNLTSPTATPPVCRRPEGDANCDGIINGADYDILKSKLNGNAYTCSNCNADFNNDNKVDLRDYEIWRNSFLH